MHANLVETCGKLVRTSILSIAQDTSILSPTLSPSGGDVHLTCSGETERIWCWTWGTSRAYSGAASSLNSHLPSASTQGSKGHPESLNNSLLYLVHISFNRTQQYYQLCCRVWQSCWVSLRCVSVIIVIPPWGYNTHESLHAFQGLPVEIFSELQQLWPTVVSQ